MLMLTAIHCLLYFRPIHRYVLCIEMFGVSDHDLMFAIGAKRAVEGDGDDDGNENDARFIQDKV